MISEGRTEHLASLFTMQLSNFDCHSYMKWVVEDQVYKRWRTVIVIFITTIKEVDELAPSVLEDANGSFKSRARPERKMTFPFVCKQTQLRKVRTSHRPAIQRKKQDDGELIR